MEANETWEQWREKIIGLGDLSSRKSYYPELQKKIEELTNSEINLRTVFNSTHDAIIIHDLDGKVLEVNDKMLLLYGVKRSEFQKFDIYDYSGDTEKKLDLPGIWNMVLNGNDHFMEWLARRPLDNTVFYVEVALTKIIWNGEDEILAAVRDITARKKAESERLRLQNLESLGILAGGIAHDFNNMLTSILGRISLSILLLPEGDVKKYLIDAEHSIKRATGLTRQLLTFAKGGTPEKSKIDLDKIIKETTEFSLSGSNVSSEFIFNGTLNINADPGQIAQVIQNLVINAKQAMPKGGKIIISTDDYYDKDGKIFVKIKIRDSGCGIPKQILSKIFDPYFTTKETGTGLGLSVCHSIIRRHEGIMEVESVASSGTEFIIILPAYKSDFQSESNEEDELHQISELNILVMDDELELREFLTDALTELGHHVIVSKEGNEALDILNRQKAAGIIYNLALLDLTIKNGLGGKETVKKIKEFDPNIKTVVMSGYADISVASYKEYGFDTRLNKPFTITELNEVIFSVMKL